MIVRTVLAIAALTLQEAVRRRVLRSLVVMTVVLLALSAWGFYRLDAEFGTFTTAEARIASSTVLNLVMFGLSRSAPRSSPGPPSPARSSPGSRWRS